MSSSNDQCPSYETRSAIQIAWSCIAIIFACTWTAVHPNVPPAHISSSKWRMAWRRVKMMLWTILLPDLMLIDAISQVTRTRQISDAAHARTSREVAHASDQRDVMITATTQATPESSNIDIEASAHSPFPPPSTPIVPAHNWTRTHSFFLIMGGFAVTDEDADSWRAVSVSEVLDGRIPWPTVKEADILNGSKGDALSKTIVIFQVTWFLIQFLVRLFHPLPVTELEWVTYWYACFCGLLYQAWFSKPYDVHQPILLAAKAPLPEVDCTQSCQMSNFLSGNWVWEAHSRVIDAAHDRRFCSLRTAIFLFINALVMWASHLVVWSLFRPPTLVEYMLWFSASVCAFSIPLLYALLILIYENFFTGHTHYIKRISSVLVPFLFNIYIIARIILFAQSFALLRRLSPLTMQVVPWTSYLPHV